MKKTIIIVLSVLILISLSIGTLVYQKQKPIALPDYLQPNAGQDLSGVPDEAETLKEALRPVNTDAISYSLQNDELNITYNNGTDWIKVPIETNMLFAGEYQGNKQWLIDDSYILTEERAAFLYAQGSRESTTIQLAYSLDGGKTWQDSVITDSFPAMRFRKVGFINEQFGYVIVSGGRTMSQEYSTAFLTHDGGQSWEQTADTGNTRLIADGGFVDESTGFMSYGTINPEQPDFYVTQDGGKSWSKSIVNIPAKYDQIFVQAETPVIEGNHLTVLVNQGPNGDYEGGKVKGKFISEDNGKSWEFATEVQVDEVY
ncbi:WD40/YVTN/BNR-like repeat-containing protein [Ornithinibacillus contaminans]|uniref:WD40/YVTN/BNR-like repeat-containing protein n=1 Tax=Ornithinibacillus contaminans TaxID=694055 RepID=UPI00064E08CA|nr:sialidase family protein [Ornithinibacillus contaminans]